MISILISQVLCALISCQSFDLVARTQHGIFLISVDDMTSSAASTLLVSSIPEELSVLMTVDTSGTFYYTLRNHLYSLSFANNTSVDLGRVGYVLEESPSSIAFDWITRKIFIALSGVGHDSSARIFACSIASARDCALVIYDDLDYLHSLCLDTSEGSMYWFNGVTKRIEKSLMNGQQHDKYIYNNLALELSKDATLSSLALDLMSRRIYFVRTQRNWSEIWYCDMFGRDSCAKVFQTEPMQSFTVFKSRFIWSTSRTGELVTCEKTNCDHTHKIISNVHGVGSFVVLDPSTQPRRTKPNPCSERNGGCSHFCLLLNLYPWSQCFCPLGIKLLDDGKTCDPRGIDKILFISAVSGIYKISLDTDDYTPKQMFYESPRRNGLTSKFYDIDFDPIDGKIYWIDAGVGQINRCSVECSLTEHVMSIPTSVKVFRLDYLARNIYWIDSAQNRIFITRIGTIHTRFIVVYGVSYLHTMTLNLQDRQLFFIDSVGLEYRIERCDLDGMNRRQIIVFEKYAFPHGIVVDSESNRLYWTEGNNSVVKTAFLNGTEPKVIGTPGIKISQPYSISILDQMLYCNSLAGRAFTRISTKSVSADIIESSIYGPIGLLAVSLHKNVSSDKACAQADCSHLCIPSSHGVPACRCSSGFELMNDGRTCKRPPAYFVLCQEGIADIFRASLETPANFDSLGILNMTDPPTTADIDQRDSYIIYGYSSSSIGYIKRVSLGDAISETVINDSTLIGIHSLAVDWISKNIYWSNPIRERIEVCDHSGVYRRTLAFKSIRPTSLVVHPKDGFLFYVNEKKNTTIKRMPLFGDSFGGVDIVGDLSRVRSLTIDFHKDLLYWVEMDGPFSRIFAAKLSGSYRELLYVGTDASPHRLYHFNHKLYYSDDKHNSIGYYNGRELITLHTNFSNVSTLLIYHGSATNDTNLCAYERSDCPQLCFIISQTERSCLCSDHFTLDQQSLLCNAPANIIVSGNQDGFLIMNLRQLPDKTLSYYEEPIVEFLLSSIGVPQSIAMDTSSRLIFWIDAMDSSLIKFSRLIFPAKMSVFSIRHNCSVFHSLAVDENSRILYASCHSKAGIGYVYAYRIKDTYSFTLELVGQIVSGSEVSLATGYVPVPRDITVLPQANYLFYVDVSPFLPSPFIIQCQLDGRKCETWLSKDLWPATRIYADPIYLRLYYTCPSGVWSSDISVASSSMRHHFISSIANDYSVAPLSEYGLLVAQISSNNSAIIELPSNRTVALPKSTSVLQRFVGISSRVCHEASCSHLCRFVRDSKQKYECTCPLGYTISSENPSLCLPNIPCDIWQFACDDQSSCIHSAKKCDRVPDCADGSDELPSLCRNVGPDKWQCNDGSSSIQREFLCNGEVDCEDGSDERHCRCSMPALELDCSAFPLITSGECIKRRLACDGFPDCENGIDENPKICLNYSDISRTFHSSPEWLYIFLLGSITFMCTTVIIFSCFRKYSICDTSRLEAVSSSRQLRNFGSAEASILPPPISRTGAQVEMALQTYSVASSSSYPASPPPNSTQSLSRFSDSHCRSNIKNITSNRFYAPPPSAASLSVYGVVKPAGVRFSIVKNRQNLRRKRQSSPPPSYAMCEDTTTATLPTDLVRCYPQMCSTPKLRRCSATQSLKHADIRPKRTPSRLLNTERTNSHTEPVSSSSLSSHFSDDAPE